MLLPERPADVIDNLVAILDQRLPGEPAAAEEVDEDVTPAKGLARALSLLIRKINPDLSKFAQDLGITAQALSLALLLVAEHSLCMQLRTLRLSCSTYLICQELAWFAGLHSSGHAATTKHHFVSRLSAQQRNVSKESEGHVLKNYLGKSPPKPRALAMASNLGFLTFSKMAVSTHLLCESGA